MPVYTAGVPTISTLGAATDADLDAHTTSTSNPHSVTAAQAGALPIAGGQMTGNITMSGAQTVDGRDLSADGAVLDAATASNNVSTIVRRDSSGNFNASTITASLTGVASGNLTQAQGDARYDAINAASAVQTALTAHIDDASAAHAATAISYTPASPADWPGDDPTTSAGALDSLASQVAQLPAAQGGTGGTGGADPAGTTATHAALTTAHGSTPENTASAIVQRDASGNFSAGTITAALTGTASGNQPLATPLTALASAPSANTLPFGSGATWTVQGVSGLTETTTVASDDLILIETSAGTLKKAQFGNAAQMVGSGGSSDAVPWSRITASQTAVASNAYGLDTVTAGAGLKLTLPSSPAAGTAIQFAQIGGQYSSFVISPTGGKPINKIAAPSVVAMSRDGAGVEARYVDATAGWITRADTPPMPATGLWLTSQNVTGSTVSSWVDVVGAKDFVQATGSAQPAYSATGFGGLRPAITPDGGDRLAYSGALLTPQAFWVSAVFRAHATTNGILIGEYDSAAPETKHWFFGNGTGATFGLVVYDDDASFILARPTVTAGTYYWALGVWDGTSNANAVTTYLATAGTTITATVSTAATGFTTPTWGTATPTAMFSGLTSGSGAFYWPASSPVLAVAYGLGVPTADQISGIYRSMWGIGTGGM